MAKLPNKNAASKTEKVDLNLSDENKSFQERIDEVRTLVEENLRYTKTLKQSGPRNELSSQKELQQLLQENLKISKDLYQMTKKINHWIVWQRVWGILKILVIVVPIILASIYLPPLLGQVLGQYQQLLNLGKSVDQNVDQIRDEDLLKQINEQPQNDAQVTQ